MSGGPTESWTLSEERRKLLRKLLFDYVSPRNARRLRDIIDEFMPDVVHFHNIYGLSSQLIRVASERRPTVVTLHDYWPLDVFVPGIEKGRRRYPARNTLLQPWVLGHRALHRRNLCNAMLVAPSAYLAQRMLACGYRDVTVIPNGVFAPEKKTAREPLLLFVGRLAPEKGIQTVLSVASRIAADAGWRVEVVGDGPLRAQLEEAAPNVHFSGWTDPAPFYQRAGIVALPSVWPENQPYVVLEAMSYGIPVLASNVGGVPELVEDGRTGVLFEAGNAISFAAGLQQLIHESGAEALGCAARERIIQHFQWDVVGPKYLTFYNDAISSHSGLQLRNN